MQSHDYKKSKNGVPLLTKSFDQIIESSGKKEKVVYENWGLETAADANGPTLKEFSNIVKAL